MSDKELARERDHTETHDDPAPESEDNTQVADAGIPGQIQYPDREVYAERAAAFAAGKVDTLYPEDEDEAVETDEEGNPLPGDETGEETEPAAMRGPDADVEDEEADSDRSTT